MADNTLTGLIPTIYESMDIVAREMVGFIPAVFKNSSAARAAVGETIRYPIVPAISLVAGSASLSPVENGEATIGYADMTLSKDYYAPVQINGEETKGLGNSGQGQNIMRDRFAQAIRALVNQIDADLATQYIYASRAVKTSGLELFDSTDKLRSLAQLRRILMDDGAQGQPLELVLGSSASALLRSTDFLFKVNEAGTSDLLRNGAIARLMEFNIHESAGIISHTNGDYTDSVCTALALNGTAITGTSLGGNLKGDLLKIANDDDNVYVLNADATATAGVINAPGSRVAHAAATDAITPLIATSYIPNMAFAKNAIHLCTRAPAMPDGGDAAVDSTMITDPITGLTFEVRKYAEHRRVKYEVCCVWGWKVVKPEFVALLAE
jgi:hypothetical protein